MASPANEALISVRNMKPDTLRFHPVYDTTDGKPAKDDKGRVLKPQKAKSVTLELGSALDKGIEKALQPETEIPKWALEHYRKHPTFKQLQDSGHILVHTAA